MMTLERPNTSPASFVNPAEGYSQSPRLNSTTLENYLKGLLYPASKRGVLHQAESLGAPENVMAFFVNRLPQRQFRSASDISFTVFTSSYFFGQD